MNFAIPDDFLALDGTECTYEKHFPRDPCTWLMPELGWEYSYFVLCCVCLTWLISYTIVCFRALNPANIIVESESETVRRRR